MNSDDRNVCAEQARICLALDTRCSRPESAKTLAGFLDNPRLACVRLSEGQEQASALKSAVIFLKQTIRNRDISLIIDSRFELAEPLGLDGAHLADGPNRIREARAALGQDMIIGAFCGVTRHSALLAGEFGADYVSFGPVCQTGISGGDTAPPELFAWWKEFTVLPSMAEGGIDTANADSFGQLADFVLIDRREEVGCQPGTASA